ncbi:22351_t:CDS:2, partial [Rhizophagus irregularis]
KRNRANKDHSDSSEKTDSNSSGSSVDESRSKSSKTKSHCKKSKRNASRSSSMSHEERNTSRDRLIERAIAEVLKELKVTAVPKLTIAAKVPEVQKETIGDTTGAIGNQKEMLFSIRSTLNYLVEEVHILKMKQSRNNTTVNRDESVSPELTVQSQRKVLQDMTIEQFKSFRDEIIQILADLDDSLSLDHTKPWNKIYKHVSKNIMPAVDKVLNSIIWYNPTELKYALQQLHHHRRENWQISQDDEKSKADKKRKGTNARRSDKKERQKRRFLHMYNTNDPVLLYSQPNSLSDKKYKKDIEELATNGAYHSDEMSEIDEEKMQKEIAKN